MSHRKKSYRDLDAWNLAMTLVETYVRAQPAAAGFGAIQLGFPNATDRDVNSVEHR